MLKSLKLSLITIHYTIFELLATPLNDKEIINLLRLDKKQGCELLYTMHSSLLYGFIKQSVSATETATKVLLSIFATAYREIDMFLTEGGNVFMWLLNIARRILNANNVEHTSFTMPYELVLYLGMNCKQAAYTVQQSENEVKKDLYKALLKNRLPSA